MLISNLLLSLTIPPTILAIIAEPSLPPFPNPIPLSSLPSAYPSSLTAQNPALDLQIRNTLSHYPLAVDGKDFPAFSLVFTQDVVANYSAPLGVLTGLASLISTVEASLAPVRTQHALSTEVIEILEGGVAARSLTYFTATHFGVGVHYGQVRRLKSVSFVCLFLCCGLASSIDYQGSCARLFLGTRLTVAR